jgi:hypothetical protein
MNQLTPPDNRRSAARDALDEAFLQEQEQRERRDRDNRDRRHRDAEALELGRADQGRPGERQRDPPEDL